ncbi:hypothetical protein ABGB08_23095 [Acrocarpospora sp. B8E8]
MTSAAFISLLALAFTIGSFWWLHARQGRLQAFEPHTFAGSFKKNLAIRIPLILFNTGAKPIVVQDLRMRFLDEPGTVLPLPWRNTRSRFDPGKGDYKDLPAVFAVEGRKALELIADFGTPFGEFAFEPKEQRVEIEAKLGHHDGWMPLLTFTLHLENVTDPGIYLAYSNDPGQLAPSDQERADRLFRSLAEELKPEAASGEQVELDGRPDSVM